MKWLHKKQEFTPSMIGEEEPKALLNDINRVLLNATSKGFEDNIISPAMRYKLENSVFLFSGFKTIQELSEAGSLLRDNEGKIKPFNKFLQEVRKIDNSYNKDYLRSEYEFAVSSAQMAAKWDDSDDDTILQYRTAGDSKVRETHAALDGITLPKDDVFWDSYYAPNGWGCRCNVVEVLSGKYKESNSKDAQELGSKALSSQGDKGMIFKFNAGKTGQIFPPKHPYNCRSKSNCTKIGLVVKIGQNALCMGCNIIVEVRKEQVRQTLKRVDKEVKEFIDKKVLSGQTLKMKTKTLKTETLEINRNSIKRYLSHAKSTEAKELIYDIDNLASQFKHIGYGKLGKGKDLREIKDIKNIDSKKKRGVTGYNYYTVEIKGKIWQFDMEVLKKGSEQLYSIRLIK